MLDLLEGGKLKKRVDTKTDDKLAQKVRLKSMLLADQIPLRRLVCFLMMSEFTNLVCYCSYMTAMGALNITLDQKTKDMLATLNSDPEGHEGNRRRTIENVANLAINSQIQLILPPDGAGDSIGGGPTRGHAERGRGRGRPRGRGRGRGRVGGRNHVGTLQPNGKLKCNTCQRC